MQGDSPAQVFFSYEEEACVPRFSGFLGLMVTLSSLSLPLELISGMCHLLLDESITRCKTQLLFKNL